MRRILAVTSVTALVAGSSSAVAQASFTGLGVLAPGAESFGTAVSADGSVAAGYSQEPGGYYRAVRWTPAGGLRDLGVLPGQSPATSSYARSISAGGAVIAGDSGTAGFRWTEADGMQALAVLGDSNYAQGLSVSADGAIIAGESGNRAVRWTAEDGAQSLGLLPGGSRTSAAAADADGGVVVGVGDNADGAYRAFRWTIAGGMQDLGLLAGASYASAWAVSGDGRVTAGESGGHAAAWTSGVGGGPRDLGVLAGLSSSVAYAASGDGSAIAGYSTLYPAYRAFLWTPASGMVDLNMRLTALGVDLTGWTLTYANAISADGTTIVGTGVHAGHHEGWIAHVPAPCRADFDGNGAVNVQDFLGYLQAYATGDPRADTDGSGSITVQDFLGFLNLFGLGC
jgi:probable HAF family extracellular repeat protein